VVIKQYETTNVIIELILCFRNKFRKIWLTRERPDQRLHEILPVTWPGPTRPDPVRGWSPTFVHLCVRPRPYVACAYTGF